MECAHLQCNRCSVEMKGSLLTRMFLQFASFSLKNIAFEPSHYKTIKLAMRTTKTQISLGIRQVWSEPSLCVQWVAMDPTFLHADSEDSDQTGRMPRLIWVFAGCTTTLLLLSWGGLFYTDSNFWQCIHTILQKVIVSLVNQGISINGTHSVVLKIQSNFATFIMACCPSWAK